MRVCFLVKMMLFLFIALPAVSPGADTPQEYRVKAGFVLNFPLFAELPKRRENGSPFTICIIGDTPLEGALALAKGKRIGNNPLVIELINDSDQMEPCRVLFIAPTERYRLQPLLAEAGSRGILTVSDMRDFVRMGGMIGLVTVNSRITFELNQTAARKASISFDTQLLKLARDVRK